MVPLKAHLASSFFGFSLREATGFDSPINSCHSVSFPKLFPSLAFPSVKQPGLIHLLIRVIQSVSQSLQLTAESRYRESARFTIQRLPTCSGVCQSLGSAYIRFYVDFVSHAFPCWFKTSWKRVIAFLSRNIRRVLAYHGSHRAQSNVLDTYATPGLKPVMICGLKCVNRI